MDAHICRECRDGKHVNCAGWSIDEDTDAITDCDCTEDSHPWNRREF